MAFTVGGPVLAWCIAFIACIASSGPDYHNLVVQSSRAAKDVTDTKILKLRAENERLTSQYPQMDIEFRDGDDWFATDGGGFVVYVSSDSPTRTIHGAYLSVTAVSLLGVPDGSETPLAFDPPLPRVISGPPRDIHSGERIPVRVCMDYRAGGYFIGFNDNTGFTLHLGAYRIALRVHGQNARFADLSLVIGRNSHGKLICEVDKSDPSHRNPSKPIKHEPFYEPLVM